MTEEWRDVVGYEGYYKVSNLGNVRSVTRTVAQRTGSTQVKQGRNLKPRKNHKGYFQVKLSKNNREKLPLIHVLVAEAFHGPRVGDMQVDHIDGDKTNNSVENLEWVTPKENVRRATEAGLNKLTAERAAKASKVATEVNKKPVNQLTKAGELINTFSSLIEAEEQTGVPRKAISNVINGYQKSARGYKWELANKTEEQ